MKEGKEKRRKITLKKGKRVLKMHFFGSKPGPLQPPPPAVAPPAATLFNMRNKLNLKEVRGGGE